MRGIDTSSTATSGRSAWVDSSAPTPSSASATTCMSAWRSISIRRPERTMPWSSAIRTRIIGSSASRTVPPPGAERTSSSPPTSRARSAMPLRPRPGAGRRSSGARRGRGRSRAPSSRTRSSVPSSSAPPAPPPRGGAGVALDVRERLLGHAVDRGLHVLAELAPGRRRVCIRTSTPVRAAKRLSWASIAGTRPWSSSAVGRSWRARLSSSSIAWFTSRLSSATSCGALGRRVLGERLEPQQDRGERLVHLVVEVARQPAALLLLRAHHELAGAAALLLDALEQAPEGLGQAVDLLGRARRRGRARASPGCGGIDPLDPLDQALERAEAALEHPHVHAEREHDRQREHQELPALARRPGGRGPRRGSRRAA